MLAKRKILQFISHSLTVVILVIGSLTFLGYLLNRELIPKVLGSTIMNPITAFCFMVAGIWLLLYEARSKIAKPVFPVVIVILLSSSFFKIIELFGIHNALIDNSLLNKLFTSSEEFKSIAPNSAILLLLTGLILLSTYKQSKKIKLLNDIFKIVGFLVSYLATIGYIYNFEIVYRYRAFVPMAFNSAIAYNCFFIVVMIMMPPGKILRVIGSGYLGGRMARRAIPLVLLLPLALGYLRLMGENATLFDAYYGTALESSFMVLTILVFVFLYARRLNLQDKERQEAELQIADSERKYRTLVYALREGVIYYDTNGIISFCNKSFSELSGYSEEEIKGKSVFDFFTNQEQKEKYKKLLENWNDGLKSEIYEENVMTRQGESIWVSISAKAVLNEQGEMVAALSTIVDITERKKQIEDIEAFSASAAHDINAPLARIEMIAMLLIESTENQLDDENLELLKAITGITSNMRTLLSDLLQFSKLGINSIEKTSIDTTVLVTDVINTCKHLNPKAIITFNPLPHLRADKSMLKQVFTNLIGNALKYSSNKENPLVEIGCIEEQGTAIIYIKDNGAGFDMKDAHKLFAAFQRLHVEFDGNGLGLPIVRRIIEKHGGKIWAEGMPCEGATFYFTLN